MLPGLAPFTLLNLLLTLGGFVGGLILWNILASHSGTWERMKFDAPAVQRLLVKQITAVVIIMTGLILLSNVIGGAVGGFLGWMSTVAGIIFWGYLGALAITAFRGSKLQQ
jgi:uncharacterized Tic20 family protein